MFKNRKKKNHFLWPIMNSLISAFASIHIPQNQFNFDNQLAQNNATF